MANAGKNLVVTKAAGACLGIKMTSTSVLRAFFQKVCRLTQLNTRYLHHIFFNIVSCKCNAVGPAFIQSSDSVVEELFLLFQPAICRVDNVPSAKLSIRMRDVDHHLTHGSLGPPESTPQRISRLVQLFLLSSTL